MRRLRVRAGWEAYIRVIVSRSPSLSNARLRELERAYFSGAAVLFATLTGKTSVLSEGDDVTAGDMQVMEDLQVELDAFGVQLDNELLGNNKGRNQQ